MPSDDLAGDALAVVRDRHHDLVADGQRDANVAGARVLRCVRHGLHDDRNEVIRNGGVEGLDRAVELDAGLDRGVAADLGDRVHDPAAETTHRRGRRPQREDR
ncbi:MAG: hypothetical protein V9G12_15475 [Microthrixaceae bacterium]